MKIYELMYFRALSKSTRTLMWTKKSKRYIGITSVTFIDNNLSTFYRNIETIYMIYR